MKNKNELNKFICQFCGRECKNLNSLRQHEIRCRENPNKIDITNSINNLYKYNKQVQNGTSKVSNQFIKAKELGLPKPLISKETRYKLGKGFRGKSHSLDTKVKISNHMKQIALENPEIYSHSAIAKRIKRHKYKNVLLDSTWELEVAKYLDKNQIKWQRPKEGFEYEWNESKHIYFPDFYLPQYDFYIEVKGYQRDRDLLKWKVVDKLIVIKQREIEAIRKDTYQIMKLIYPNF